MSFIIYKCRLSFINVAYAKLAFLILPNLKDVWKSKTLTVGEQQESSWWRDALSQALCNLSSAFLADFTQSDSATALVRFHSFLSQITLWFSLGSKDMITAFHVVRLTLGTAALHCEHTFVGSRHTYCQWPIAMNVSTRRKQNGRQPRGPYPYACAFSAE